MAKQFYAVMGIDTYDYSGLEDLGENIMKKMYDENALLFPNPLDTKVAFTKFVTDFEGVLFSPSGVLVGIPFSLKIIRTFLPFGLCQTFFEK